MEQISTRASLSYITYKLKIIVVQCVIRYLTHHMDHAMPNLLDLFYMSVYEMAIEIVRKREGKIINIGGDWTNPLSYSKQANQISSLPEKPVGNCSRLPTATCVSRASLPRCKR